MHHFVDCYYSITVLVHAYSRVYHHTNPHITVWVIDFIHSFGFASNSEKNCDSIWKTPHQTTAVGFSTNKPVQSGYRVARLWLAALYKEGKNYCSKTLIGCFILRGYCMNCSSQTLIGQLYIMRIWTTIARLWLAALHYEATPLLWHQLNVIYYNELQVYLCCLVCGTFVFEYGNNPGPLAIMLTE